MPYAAKIMGWNETGLFFFCLTYSFIGLKVQECRMKQKLWCDQNLDETCLVFVETI